MIYIYGTKGCQFCQKAKILAEDCYGAYKFLDIGITMYYNQLKERNVSTNVLPQIFEDKEYIGTYYDFVKLNQYKMENLEYARRKNQ